MKTIPVCRIFAAIALAAPLVLAQAPERPAPGDMWSKADRDRDGSISATEFAGIPRVSRLTESQRGTLFGRLDKNGDGRIERAEIRAAGQHEAGRPAPLPGIRNLDRDGDGAVSFEELQAGPMLRRLDPERQKRLFARLDSDGDGTITAHDKPGRHAPPDGGLTERPNARGLVTQLDQDGDARISFEEFRAHPRAARLSEEAARKRYDALDRNRDGTVDRGDVRRPSPEPGSHQRGESR